MGFLNNNEPEALEIVPVERLTVERVKLFVQHLAETNAPNSVANIVERLYMSARSMMPDRDWGWLKRIKTRLHAAAPARTPAGPVITSVQLLKAGLHLMNENRPASDKTFTIQQAVAYRDGLVAALVAYVPIRPRNLTSLEIGRHVVRDGERWFVFLPRDETKTSKRVKFEIPEILIPYLNLYLENVRPKISGGKTLNALWVSPKGGRLSYVGITKSFARLSTRLGVRFSPHDARDAAVTTWAIARPDQICVARDLLYHSKLDTTDLYNRTKGIEASRAYRLMIREIRNKQRRSENAKGIQ